MAQVTLSQMLEARERRARRQEDMLRQYPLPLISFTMNIPGPVKRTAAIQRAYETGRDMLIRRFHPVHMEEEMEDTGCVLLMAVEGNARDIKRQTAAMEDGDSLGRLFDMDVLDETGNHIGRAEMGLPERQCMLCQRPAHECARSRSHSVDELWAHVQAVIQEALWQRWAQKVAGLAQKAMLYEVSVTPKPGLVDRQDSGAHEDMDFFTFMASASALYPYLEKCAMMGARQGKENPEKLFLSLREPGMQAEEAMYAATRGVNTHKGAIFIMGIACAAAGALGRDGQDVCPDEILDLCTRMTRQEMEKHFARLTPQTARTAGDRLYVEYGLTGVRGQAAMGFPAVKERGLPLLKKALKEGMNLNDGACLALLGLMSVTQDTVPINRSSLPVWQQIARDVGLSLERGEDVQTTAARLNRQFISQGISPGGCADLLSLTLFLYFMEQR